MTITDGGVYVLTGVHADGNVTVSGGSFAITTSGDGLNAAGGADQSGFGGRGPDNNGGNMGTPLHLPCRGVLIFCFCYTGAASVCPYTRVCSSVSIARSSETVRAPPVVSRYSGIGLPPGASAG